METDNSQVIEIDRTALVELKVNKKASGRHKDLDDLEHLP